MDQILEFPRNNPESPHPSVDLIKGCERLLRNNSEFTMITGEKGFALSGEFPGSYSALGLKHTAHSLSNPELPAIEDPIREGIPDHTQ